MNPYYILILLSVLVIFSYLFDMLSRRTRIPSVLLLLLLGWLLRYGSTSLNIPVYDFATLLPILGTVGLIMIVFEGALDLKYDRGKIKLIRNAFGSALFLLLLTSTGIAGLFYFYTQASFYLCLLNAIPFSVISSAIAIPSVISLQEHKKEFIIYESSFSDILGIMVFNLILSNDNLGFALIGQFGLGIVLVSFLSLVSCFVFLFVIGRMTHHVKFFLIFSVMVMIYAVGKEFHLSTLVVVLAFGLFLENIELITRKLSFFPYLKKIEGILLYPALHEDLKGLHQLTAETAFLLRTFFFLLFGYMLDLTDLFRAEVLIMGGAILFIVYLLRGFYLRLIAKSHVWPELVISPRGLISVLLFVSIPQDKLLIDSGNGLLVMTIIASGLVMTFGLLLTGKKPTESRDL